MCKRLVPSLLLLLLSVWAPRPVQAQLPVTDVGNLAVNTISSLQTTITAIEAVFQSAEWVVELTPVEGLVTGSISEDMEALGALVENAQGLSYDIGELQSQIDTLFNLDGAPNTTALLRERLMEVRRLRHTCYTYAMRTQTLLTTAARTAEHLAGLLEALGDVVGNLSVSQRASEMSATISKSAANLQVQTAAFQRAGSVDKMEELLTIESINAINTRIFDRE